MGFNSGFKGLNQMFRRVLFLVPKFSALVHQLSYVLLFVPVLLKYK